MNTKQQATDLILSVLPKDILTLSNLFTLNNKQLFLVGGCIRDSFFDKTPKDFDVCTDALPNTIIDLLKSVNIKCELRGADFGVVVACMDEDIEISSFRSDTDSGTGNNKETIVTLGVTIEDDVKRRDLTINGLFLNLQTNEIIDLVGGIDDLNNGIIRAIGNPIERFKEDNLRKLRAVRFASRLGFEIETETLKAIQLDPSLNVSSERIVNELTTSFNSAKTVEIFINILLDINLLNTIFNDFLINNNETIICKQTNVCSLNTLFASILINDFDLSKRLIEHNFSVDVANSVALLLKLENDLKNKTLINPILINRQFKSTNLTTSELCTFFKNDTKLVTWLFNFKHEDGLSEKLMKQGIKGKDLGDTLRKIAIGRMIIENK
jgi:tRNA nucleotidyltransferase (CCA-adding enzyme)